MKAGRVPMRSAKLSFLVLLALLMAISAAGTAQADTPITRFFVSPSTTQAGGHPDIRTVVEFENSLAQEHYDGCACEDVKDLAIHLPAGIIGSPQLIPHCTDVDFGNQACPPESQVGIMRVGFGVEKYDAEKHEELIGKIGIYNVIPRPSEAGLLAANIAGLNAPIYFVFEPRTDGDYGLDVKTTSIAHALSLAFSDFTIWGVPADPIHQEERHPKGCDPQVNVVDNEFYCYPGVPANTPLRPFVNNPTTCGMELTASADVLSYDRGRTHAETTFPATTGCDQLSFNPSLFGQPTTTETDSASGFDVDLLVPQGVSPSVPLGSSIRGSTIVLPPGFSINPNAADGKEACTDVQARFGTLDEAQCPESAKIGTLAISSASLPGILPGFVYLGEPKPNDTYRAILVADGFGIHVKLPGRAIPDPQTGQLTFSFRDLPQFPFSEFNLHLFGAERGLLATPTQCGTYPVHSTFVPWDSLLPEQSSVQYFTLSSGPSGTPCPGPRRSFDPEFRAGVSEKTAGRHAPFVLRLSREDGSQNLVGLDATTPPGFSATLKGVPYCPEPAIARLEDPNYSGRAEASEALCPAASQVGVVTVGAGAGSRPIHVSGKAYLAGPYKGAPLSLEVVIPAISGPYDLGNAATRVAIRVDPTTTQVTTVSDPFPQILQGIPVRTRSIQVNLDRDQFTLNPTNCDPLAIESTIFGDQEGRVDRSVRFQVANCAKLPYRPKLKFAFTGGVERRGHPAIHTTLTTTPGEANSQRVSVIMPKGVLLDNAHIRNICTRVQFVNDNCPAASVVGSAEAVTPLLGQPLRGKVYLRSSQHKLPDLAVDLEGQIQIELVGRVDSIPGRIRTVFEAVPDAPVTSFKLDLQGGSRGLLQNSDSLCGSKKRATVRMTGQNGKTTTRFVPLNPVCGNAGSEGGRRR